MKHAAFVVIAALVAAAITACVHIWGAHDIQGFLAAVAGYPGLLATLATGDTRFQWVLFTVVNWLFYFAVFEGIFAIKKRSSRP